MNRQKFILMFCCLVFFISYAKNPLEEYISDEIYEKGKTNFKQSDTIFNPKVYSLSAIHAEREASINKMLGAFQEVTFVIKSNNVWSATFYYIDDGMKRRKTISGRSKISANNSSYLVTPYEKGIKIKDIKTGYETELEKKGR